MSQDYTPEISMQSFAQGRADFAPCGVGSQPRNLIGHLATSEAFNQNQQQMVASMQQLQLSHQQLLLPQQQLPPQVVQQQQLGPTSNCQQQLMTLRQPVFSPHSVNQQQQQSHGSPQQHLQMQFLQSQQQQLQLHLSQQQMQFQGVDFGQQQHQFNPTLHHQLHQQHRAVGLQQQARSQEPGDGPKVLLPPGLDQKRQPHHLPRQCSVHETSSEPPNGEALQQLSFLASQPHLAQRHLALMDQELQLQKQLTCVTMEKLKVVDSQGDFRASGKETTVQRALGQVQKERAELEAETTNLEATAMRRQKEMVQEALRLEREMEEVVKHREIVILEYEANRLKDVVHNRVASVHQDSLGGSIVGIEAVAMANGRGRQGEDTLAGGLVFGDLETNKHISRPAVENHATSLGVLNPMVRDGEMMERVMQTAAEKQAQRTTGGRDQPARNRDVGEKGDEDGKVRAANRSIVVDLTNNSTFEVYNSDEDNSQMESHNILQENLKEVQSGGVDSSSPSLPNGQYEEVEMGVLDDGLNKKEVLAQQEKILAQIQRENEAEVRTKELLAKLALGEGEDDSKQVVAERQVVKQDERPIGTDLSEFIVVAVKKRQMKMGKKSGGGAGEAMHEMRKSGGEEDVSHRKNELEERKEACELVRQRTAPFAKENEIQPMPKRHEAATRAIEEAKKKRMMAEKKKQSLAASSSKFKPSWEKQPELGDCRRGSTSRSYGK